jgi:hypothetical protein
VSSLLTVATRTTSIHASRSCSQPRPMSLSRSFSQKHCATSSSGPSSPLATTRPGSSSRITSHFGFSSSFADGADCPGYGTLFRMGCQSCASSRLLLYIDSALRCLCIYMRLLSDLGLAGKGRHGRQSRPAGILCLSCTERTWTRRFPSVRHFCHDFGTS